MRSRRTTRPAAKPTTLSGRERPTLISRPQRFSRAKASWTLSNSRKLWGWCAGSSHKCSNRYRNRRRPPPSCKSATSLNCKCSSTDKHYTPAQQAALRAHGGGAKLLVFSPATAGSEGARDAGALDSGRWARYCQRRLSNLRQPGHSSTSSSTGTPLSRQARASMRTPTEGDWSLQHGAEDCGQERALFFRRLASPQLRFEAPSASRDSARPSR